MNDAVCIVAGGNASRFPGKLVTECEGAPLLVRVYENLRGLCPVVVSANATFSPEIDAQIECPIVIDRWPQRGPLSGLLSVFGEISAERVYAVAADSPFIDRMTLQTLHAAWAPGDEAVVAHPLCALYDRLAFLREGWPVLHGGSGAIKTVIARLRARRIALPSVTLTNINTPADAAAYLGKYQR